MITAGLTHQATRWLICRAGASVCCLPIESVLLTLRRPPLERWSSEDGLAEGVATIRGDAVPVVSLDRLLSGTGEAEEQRLIVLSVQGRRVALAVSAVLGVRSLAESDLTPLPPLLGSEETSIVHRLGRLDGQLLLVLQSGRLLGASSEASSTESHA